VHVAADLADPRAPGRLVEAARAALGHVDILVANHARSSAWLVGDEAGWVTGQIVASDGGWSAR
jgi:NAD(P)-dependent dehydrogenase (short-subunit alcohol dehydrogenase family)